MKTANQMPRSDYDVAGWQRFYAANPGFHRSVGADGAGDGGGDDGAGDGGDGGGDGGAGGALSQADIDAAIEKATGNLKAHNQKLIDEKRELESQFKGIKGTLDKLGGDDGINALLTMKKNLEKDEVGKLLAEGKHDEWFEKRAASLKRDYENQLKNLSTQLEQATETNSLLDNKLRGTVLKAEVLSAAKDAGTLPSAVPDIQLRAERAFTFDTERETLVVKDENGGVLFGKDGTAPKTVAEWLDEQKEAARHWWPPSQGGGAGGSGDTGGQGTTEQLDKADMATFREKRMAQKKARKRYI